MSEEHAYLKEGEAAEILRRKVSTLQVWRSTKKGPKFIKDLHDQIFYRKQDLIDFMEGKKDGDQ